jgi:hypothetical protein
VAGLSIRYGVQTDEAAALFERAGSEILPRLAPWVMQALLLLQREIQELTPTASGTTRNSIAAQPPEIINDSIIGLVGSPLPQAEYLELGTAPHRPPIQPIEDWVKQKLGLTGVEATRAAWAIAGAIARRGTEGAHMFEQGFERNREQVQRILDEGVRAVLRELGLLQ